MDKIQFDVSKVKRHEGKKPKKALSLEIIRTPKSLTSIHLEEEEGYINVDDELFAFDHYYPKGNLKTGGDHSLCYSITRLVM